MKNEFRRIMKTLPDYYKLKSETKLTNYQVLIVLRLFIEKDKEREGWIKYQDMLKILNELQFRTSSEEVEALLKEEYEELTDSNLENSKITFETLVHTCDILKREKLILVQLGNNLNYLIFLMLLVLIVIYIAFFYSYRDTVSR